MSDKIIENELNRAQDANLLLSLCKHLVEMDMPALIGLVTLFDIPVNLDGEEIIDKLLDSFIEWPRERRRKIIALLDAAQSEEEDDAGAED